MPARRTLCIVFRQRPNLKAGRPHALPERTGWAREPSHGAQPPLMHRQHCARLREELQAHVELLVADVEFALQGLESELAA